MISIQHIKKKNSIIHHDNSWTGRIPVHSGRILQVGADVDALLDDGEVLVKWKPVYGLVCQLQQLRTALLPP